MLVWSDFFFYSNDKRQPDSPVSLIRLSESYYYCNCLYSYSHSRGIATRLRWRDSGRSVGTALIGQAGKKKKHPIQWLGKIKDMEANTVGCATTNECYNEQFLSIKSGCYNESGGVLSADVACACAWGVGPSPFDYSVSHHLCYRL